MRAGVMAVVLTMIVGVAAGCESDAQRAAERQLDSVQPQCSGTAKAVTGAYPAGVPSTLPLPPSSTLYHVEDRGKDGVVLSAVTPKAFKEVLHFMNTDFVAAGFKITSGETEKHDAEANWTVDGYRGRWSIREVGAQCPGDTLVMILASTTTG
jgi:hypothetical protein